MIIATIRDVVLLTVSGAGFIFGLFLIYEKSHPILALLLIFISLLIAVVTSTYDITIEKTPKERKKDYEVIKERNRAA